MEEITDLTNRAFGSLKVVGLAEERNKNSKSTYWKCQCECGNVLEIRNRKLVLGKTKSCGCRNGAGIKDLTGKIFGLLTVKELSKERNQIEKDRIRKGEIKKLKYIGFVSVNVEMF